MKEDTPIILDYKRTTFRDQLSRHWRRLPRYMARSIVEAFPILTWSTRYKLSWLLQDVIAGVTVGMVMVPQGIAYAKIANLEPQYGLYTGFVGSALYCLFGTSKDISVGPITVVSLLVGTAVANVTAAHPDVAGPQVAVYLSLVAGIILTLIGVARLGILIDFIPAPVIAGYMTGSAITISLGEWGNLTGIDIETHQQAPYQILGGLFSRLPQIQVDAAFGFVGLFFLYLARFLSAKLSTRFSRFQKLYFYFGIMRSGVLVIFATLISFLINMHRMSPSPFRIIQDVPAGFEAVGVPQLDLDIMDHLGALLPSIILILILEHMSVAKSFARMADYAIDANQEILAIGISNIVGSFLGAFPGTGAFSRTAIMARSGVKSPLASIFTSAVVVLALYVLTPAFYYIPESSLAAVIIHAVSDLMTGPRYLKDLWKTSKLEFLVFVSTVLVTFFADVETGIYVAVALSLFAMLLQLARPSVTNLARAPLMDSRSSSNASRSNLSFCDGCHTHYVYVDEQDANFQKYSESLEPIGILAFRLSSPLLYPNAGYVTERLVQTVKLRTRKGDASHQQQQQQQPPNDVLWNQKPAASSSATSPAEQETLRAIVLDFAAVTRIDSTALQSLKGARGTIDRYAGHAVEWHFASIPNAQVRNDLILWGFGDLGDDHPLESVATSNHSSSAQDITEKMQDDVTDAKDALSFSMADNLYIKEDATQTNPNKSMVVLLDLLNRLPRDRYPCFHWNVDGAVTSICERWRNRQRLSP